MPFVHQFEFQLGDKEKHTVSFYYEKWTGLVVVKVDGIPAAKDRVLTRGDVPILNLSVGNQEKHEVKFNVRPGGIFFKKPTVEAYVDGKVVKTY